jgi:hypothetical protein
MKKEILAKANELGRQMAEMGQVTTRWGMVYRWEGEIYSSVHSNTACHAGLNSPFGCSCGARYRYEDNPKHEADCAYKHRKGGCILAVVSMLWLDVPEPMAVSFLNWLFNKSQYSSAFQNRSGKLALSKGYCIADPTVNANIMAGGLVASRRLWEYTSVLHVWDELVKRGVHPALAYWLGHKSSGRAGRPNNMHMRSEMSCHTSITNSATSWAGLRSFLDGEQLPCRRQEVKSFQLDQGYGSYSGMLRKVNEPGGAPNTLVHTMSYAGVMKGEGKLNPFVKWQAALARKNAGGNKTLDFGKCMDRLAKTIVPQMMEKIYA